jgi:hypothetical protein
MTNSATFGGGASASTGGRLKRPPSAQKHDDGHFSDSSFEHSDDDEKPPTLPAAPLAESSSSSSSSSAPAPEPVGTAQSTDWHSKSPATDTVTAAPSSSSTSASSSSSSASPPASLQSGLHAWGCRRGELMLSDEERAQLDSFLLPANFKFDPVLETATVNMCFQYYITLHVCRVHVLVQPSKTISYVKRLYISRTHPCRTPLNRTSADVPTPLLPLHPPPRPFPPSQAPLLPG